MTSAAAFPDTAKQDVRPFSCLGCGSLIERTFDATGERLRRILELAQIEFFLAFGFQPALL